MAPINKGPGIILRFGSWPQPAARDQIKLHKRCEGFDQPNRSTRPDDSTVQSQEAQPEHPVGQHDPATPKRRAMDRRESKPSFTKYEGTAIRAAAEETQPATTWFLMLPIPIGFRASERT